MATTIELGDVTVDVVKKDIRNVHLSVYPPTGKVRISAPFRMELNNIRLFAITKLGWIKRQQKKLREQVRETPREYLDRESHYVWGKRYLLKVVEENAPPEVELRHNMMRLKTRPESSDEKKQAIIEEWYRDKIKETALPLIRKWELLMGVQVTKFFVQRMKTKWGSCNPVAKSIRLNTELAKKPVQCLEHIIVHEMVHLLERHHNDRFTKLMDQFLPNWRFHRDELNRAPLAHETWNY